MNFIKFLGSAGARFVVTRQVRASGGIWLSLDDTQVLIDPGPGSLVRCLSSRPKLHPTDLEGIICTHRHIDHCNDVNIMIEAMTNGGHVQKGTVFAPTDALDEDPVVLHHFRDHLDQLVRLREGKSYSIGTISFSTPKRHLHGVETYGLNIESRNHALSIISDTQYFDGLENYYPHEILILYVVLLDSKKEIQHLSIQDAKRIILKNKPKCCILTHFGMNVVRHKPWEIAEQLSQETKTTVIAARDGMTIDLDELFKKK